MDTGAESIQFYKNDIQVAWWGTKKLCLGLQVTTTKSLQTTIAIST